MIQDLGRLIITFGAVLVIIGGILILFGKFGFFGKLPGDIVIKRDNFTFYAPITTSIIISIIITILYSLFTSLRR